MAVGSTEQSASRTVVSSVDHDPVAPVLEGVDFVDRYFGGGQLAMIDPKRVLNEFYSSKQAIRGIKWQRRNARICDEKSTCSGIAYIERH
jgi:hypothetical protein